MLSSSRHSSESERLAEAEIVAASSIHSDGRVAPAQLTHRGKYRDHHGIQPPAEIPFSLKGALNALRFQ